MATVVTISQFSIPDCNFQGATAKVRRYYDSDWRDVDGVLHLEGSIGSSTDFFDEIDCTLANHTITVPAFNATPTVNAQIGSPRETWQLWDQSLRARNIIFDSGFIPSSPSTMTFDMLAIANQGQTLTNPIRTYLTQADVFGMLSTLFASLGVSGITTMQGGLATIPRQSMTANGAASGEPLTAMSGVFHAEINPGVGFSIVSSDGGDEGPILWTVYDDLS